MTKQNYTINQLINQLLIYPMLSADKKLMLGINLGICISTFLIKQPKESNKFDLLFIWLIENKIKCNPLIISNLNCLKEYLEYLPDEIQEYDEKLVDLAIYRLHNLLAVSTVIKLNMSLCLKLQTELNELIHLIEKKKNEYNNDTSNINYVHLAKLLEKDNANNSPVSFLTIYNKITHSIQTHFVNDSTIKEWEDELTLLHQKVLQITQYHPRDFCALPSPFCIPERKQKLCEFFYLLKEKLEKFIAMCQNDCIPVNKYPFCI